MGRQSKGSAGDEGTATRRWIKRSAPRPVPLKAAPDADPEADPGVRAPPGSGYPHSPPRVRQFVLGLEALLLVVLFFFSRKGKEGGKLETETKVGVSLGTSASSYILYDRRYRKRPVCHVKVLTAFS